MPFFDSARILAPNRNDINLWTDYVERLCIFSGGEISRDEFLDHLSDDGAKSMIDVVKVLNFDHGFLQPLQPNQPINDDDDDPENLAEEEVNSKIITLFSFLNQRTILFAANYPFSIDAHLDVVTLVQNRSTLQDSYLVLLFSSDLRMYTPGDINRLGHCFEAFCEQPFRMAFSPQTKIRFFGAGAGTILPADYHGNLRTRIQSLCTDLRFNFNPLIEDPDEISPGGDAGLDWVGWLPFPDEANHQPIFLGQCACGSDWVDKQHETSLSVWRNYMTFNQPLVCFHMLPRSYRRQSGAWFRETEIQEVVLLDRIRLLYLLEQAAGSYVQHGLHTALLQEALAFRLN